MQTQNARNVQPVDFEMQPRFLHLVLWMYLFVREAKDSRGRNLNLRARLHDDDPPVALCKHFEYVHAFAFVEIETSEAARYIQR